MSEMRVLLLQPEDSPRRGPWIRQRWDLVIDLGTSSELSVAAWQQQMGCPVLRSVSFRRGIEDVRLARKMLDRGRGRLPDKAGIDWWELTSLVIVPELLALIALRRMAGEVPRSAEFWATRPGGVLRLWESVFGCRARVFGDSAWERSAARAGHYASLVRHFSAGQFKEILLDKYDSEYRWRSRFSGRQRACDVPVVLLPSAYENVSRMAAAYARSFPEQSFLLVATRRSARQADLPANIAVRDLSAYASRRGTPAPPGSRGRLSPHVLRGLRSRKEEIASLLEVWSELKKELGTTVELGDAERAGVLEAIPGWIHNGLSARDAWRNVLEREPVAAVLCGDDSNLFTRLPVVLAATRKIPTADFHHGALDGRYLVKELPSDFYLAKSEMERDYLVRICGLSEQRVVIGAPAFEEPSAERHEPGKKKILAFFSEPYEVAGMRTEEVYREILPGLCRVAREKDLRVMLKLHPFELASQRGRLIREILSAEDRRLVEVVSGPLTPKLLADLWCGVTLESSSVIDCLQSGVCCFLCAWLPGTIYEYTRQYARFGAGELLTEASQIAEIPRRVDQFHLAPRSTSGVFAAANRDWLRRWLQEGSKEVSPVGARSAS